MALGFSLSSSMFNKPSSSAPTRTENNNADAKSANAKAAADKAAADKAAAEKAAADAASKAAAQRSAPAMGAAMGSFMDRVAKQEQEQEQAPARSISLTSPDRVNQMKAVSRGDGLMIGGKPGVENFDTRQLAMQMANDFSADTNSYGPEAYERMIGTMDNVARTLVGEASGNSLDDYGAAANTMVNRAALRQAGLGSKTLYGDGSINSTLRGYDANGMRFTATGGESGTPANTAFKTATPGTLEYNKGLMGLSLATTPSFVNSLPPTVRMATHYYTGDRPDWADPAVTQKYGVHSFTTPTKEFSLKQVAAARQALAPSFNTGAATMTAGSAGDPASVPAGKRSKEYTDQVPSGQVPEEKTFFEKLIEAMPDMFESPPPATITPPKIKDRVQPMDSSGFSFTPALPTPAKKDPSRVPAAGVSGVGYTPALPAAARNPVGGMSFTPGLPGNMPGGMSFTPGLPRQVPGGMSFNPGVRNPASGMSFTPALPAAPRNPGSGMSFNPEVRNPIGGMSFTPEVRNPIGGMSFTPGLPDSMPPRVEDVPPIPDAADARSKKQIIDRVPQTPPAPMGMSFTPGLPAPNFKQKTLKAYVDKLKNDNSLYGGTVTPDEEIAPQVVDNGDRVDPLWGGGETGGGLDDMPETVYDAGPNKDKEDLGGAAGVTRGILETIMNSSKRDSSASSDGERGLKLKKRGSEDEDEDTKPTDTTGPTKTQEERWKKKKKDKDAPINDYQKLLDNWDLARAKARMDMQRFITTGNA